MRPIVLLRLAHALQNRSGLPLAACFTALGATPDAVHQAARRLLRP